jgi:hypothetical protein
VFVVATLQVVVPIAAPEVMHRYLLEINYRFECRKKPPFRCNLVYPARATNMSILYADGDDSFWMSLAAERTKAPLKIKSKIADE